MPSSAQAPMQMADVTRPLRSYNPNLVQVKALRPGAPVPTPSDAGSTSTPVMPKPVRPKPVMSTSLRLALFEPDIPQNAGSVLRLAACLGVAVDVIEPCGFVWSDRRLRRAGMDYLDRHAFVRNPPCWASATTRRVD